MDLGLADWSRYPARGFEQGSHYCQNPLPADTFAPLPEMQDDGSHLSWGVRDEVGQLLVLD